MERRPFLLKTTAVMAGLAGCTGIGGESPTGTGTRTETPVETPAASPSTPEREPPDCVNPERPEPENGSGDVEPAAYPETPPTLDDTEAMADYISTYEEAYRTNTLLEQHADDLEKIYFGVGDPRFFDSPPDSAIARVRYTYGYEVGSSIADSPNTYASYYVDDSVVVRAEHEGLLDDESTLQDDEGTLEPDPLRDGKVLDCFG